MLPHSRTQLVRVACRRRPSVCKDRSHSASVSSSSGEQRDHLTHSVWEPVVNESFLNEEPVPLYYLERKRARDAIAGRKEEEGGLMYELSAGILSDAIAAETRRLDAKIPTEHRQQDGRLLHASGFVVPAPGLAPIFRAENRDRNPLIQTAAVLERVQEESDLKQVVDGGTLSANTKRLRGKIPFEVEEHDGTVRHPSGFIPPTPMTGFNTKREYHSSGGRRPM